MPGQYNLDRGGRVDAAQYKQLLADAMKRYGGNRDRAVRSANIQGGFGNSTAQRFMHAASSPNQGGGQKPAGGGGGGGGKPDKTRTSSTAQDLSGPATGAPIPMDRTTGLIEPPTLPYQSQLAGVPPDLMGLPGYDQLKGVPPDLTGGGGGGGGGGGNPPMNPALSTASILRSVPPELLGGADRGGLHITPALQLGRAGRVGSVAGAAGRMAQNAVSGSGVSPDGRIHFNPFKVEPQDPNEPWWRAMLRG